MQKVYERIVWADFPSTKTALASRLLNQMDYAIDEIDNRVVELSGYQEEALLSEQNSKESEIKAKISETNAKESEVKSKEYMEKAFTGTPEGYEELVDRVNFPIVTTTELTLPNSAAGGLRVNHILGNSYQNVYKSNQLLNPTIPSSGTATTTISDDGYTMTCTSKKAWGQANICEIPVSGGETIYISAEKLTNSIDDRGKVMFDARNATSVQASFNLTQKNLKGSFTIPADCTILRVLLRANNISTEAETENTLTVEGLLVTREENATWEPYNAPKNRLSMVDPEILANGWEETNSGVTFTYVADDNGRLAYIEVKGTATSGFMLQISQRAFTMNEELVFTSGISGASEDTYSIAIIDTDNRGEYYDYGNGVVVPKVLRGSVVFRAKEGAVIDVKLYPMLSKYGGEYEPYGTPFAPSPENQAWINNVGSCPMIQSGKYGATGTFEESSNWVCSKFEIQCKEGETFSVKVDKKRPVEIIYYKNGVYYDKYSTKGYDGVVFSIEEGVTSFNFNVGGFINNPIDGVGKIELKLEKDNGAEYYPIVIQTKNKNLMRLEKASSATHSFVTNEDGTYTAINSTNNAQSGPRFYATEKLKAGTYTITNISGSGSLNIMRKSGDYSNKVAVGESKTFYYDGESYLVLLYGNVQANSTVVFKVQLEEGDVATDFVPAKETQTIVLVDQPLRKGDELCKKDGVWYVKRNTVRKSLKGLTWGSTNGVWHYTDKISDIALTKTTTDGAKMSEAFLCTHLPYKSDRSFIVNGKELGITAWYGVDYSAYRLAVYPNMTLEEWETFVEKTDVYIEYPLAESVFEELSVDNQIALNSIETFADTTHIIVDSYIPTSGILSEYGTTKIAAYTLKSLLNSESNKVLIEELSTAIMAVGSEE